MSVEGGRKIPSQVYNVTRALAHVEWTRIVISRDGFSCIPSLPECRFLILQSHWLPTSAVLEWQWCNVWWLHVTFSIVELNDSACVVVFDQCLSNGDYSIFLPVPGSEHNFYPRTKPQRSLSAMQNYLVLISIPPAT